MRMHCGTIVYYMVSYLTNVYLQVQDGIVCSSH